MDWEKARPLKKSLLFGTCALIESLRKLLSQSQHAIFEHHLPSRLLVWNPKEHVQLRRGLSVGASAKNDCAFGSLQTRCLMAEFLDWAFATVWYFHLVYQLKSLHAYILSWFYLCFFFQRQLWGSYCLTRESVGRRFQNWAQLLVPLCLHLWARCQCCTLERGRLCFGFAIWGLCWCYFVVAAALQVAFGRARPFRPLSLASACLPGWFWRNFRVSKWRSGLLEAHWSPVCNFTSMLQIPKMSTSISMTCLLMLKIPLVANSFAAIPKAEPSNVISQHHCECCAIQIRVA